MYFVPVIIFTRLLMLNIVTCILIMSVLGQIKIFFFIFFCTDLRSPGQVHMVDEACVYAPPSKLQVPDTGLSGTDSALSAPDSDDGSSDSSSASSSPTYSGDVPRPIPTLPADVSRPPIPTYAREVSRPPILPKVNAVEVKTLNGLKAWNSFEVRAVKHVRPKLAPCSVWAADPSSLLVNNFFTYSGLLPLSPLLALPFPDLSSCHSSISVFRDVSIKRTILFNVVSDRPL